eukprot:COSAG02_NODE_7_length_64539_cov_120.393482_2_plen_668_part_00
MLRSTPSRGPPVICLLDSSSDEEDTASGVGRGNWCAEDVRRGGSDDDVCMVTAVVTAEDRAAAARRAAVVLDSSTSPQPSPISSPAMRSDHAGDTRDVDESAECDRSSDEASVWGRLAVGGTAVKHESSALPNGKPEPGTLDISSGIGERTRANDMHTGQPLSDSEDEDLYGPESSSASRTCVRPAQPATVEARERADAATGWSDPDIKESTLPLGAVQAAILRDELRGRKTTSSGGFDEASRQMARSPTFASCSSSDDDDVDPYAAAQTCDTEAIIDEGFGGDFDVGADTLFDDPPSQDNQSREAVIAAAVAKVRPDHGDHEEEDEEAAVPVDRRRRRNRVILEDSSDEDENEVSEGTSDARSLPRRHDLLDEDENAASGDIDLSTSLDQADELARELEDLQLYTTSIITPDSKRVDAQVESSVGRRSARLSARKQQTDRGSRQISYVSSGEEHSDEEPWNRSEEEDSSVLAENSLDDFIVDSDEEDDRLPGELGQLLTKLRGTNARGDYSDDDSDFSAEELEGEYYDPNDLTMEQTVGVDGSVISDDNADDDGASLLDFVVDEDSEDSQRSGRHDQVTSQAELLQDLTNLNVSSPSETKRPDDLHKPNKTKKKEVKGWTLSRVATAVRESGRALGPRSNVSIAPSEWARNRKRLTREIFEDLNTR